MPLLVCRLLDSPSLLLRLRLPNVSSFLRLMTWHVSCFLPGERPEKGYIPTAAEEGDRVARCQRTAAHLSVMKEHVHVYAPRA
jgi:hypothetical protein